MFPPIPLQKVPPRHRVLIIGYVWPEFTSSAAGIRTWNLIDSFRKAGWEITFASPSVKNGHSEKLEALGVSTVMVQANDSAFDSWIKDLGPTLVVFDRFVIEEQFGWRVQDQCPEAIRVLDTQDLHFLRRARQRALEEGAPVSEIFQGRISLDSDDLLRELGSIYRCDGTLLISNDELDLLVTRFGVPQELLFLSRFHYPDPPSAPGFEERTGFCMIGNFRHPPNRDSVLWLRNEIWPRIRERLPTAEVHIYGAYPPREMMSLHQPREGFLVLGPVPNSREMLRAYRVNLAPLRMGAGIKGKISDGWWSGTPVVTTPIGSEGMAEGLPWGGAVASSADAFVEEAVQLYTKADHWEQMQKQGLELMRTLYSAERNSTELVNYLSGLVENRDSLRKLNLVG